ncbi:MAG: hypothetical protein RIQ60_123 [Pseudomonadota bacterium]|jgi:uncharacterized membrane protein
MYLVAIGWIYVALMMAVAEAMHPQGGVLGAIVTFVLYGVLPVSIVVYLMGTPMRRRARKAAEAAELKAANDGPARQPSPAGDAVSPAAAADEADQARSQI